MCYECILQSYHAVRYNKAYGVKMKSLLTGVDTEFGANTPLRNFKNTTS